MRPTTTTAPAPTPTSQPRRPTVSDSKTGGALLTVELQRRSCWPWPWPYLTLLGLGLLTLTGCSATGGGPGSAVATAPLFYTPAWHDNAPAQYGDRILLRRAGEDVLLRHSRLGGAYRYEPRTRRLVPVEPGEWEQAHSKVTDCDRQYEPSRALLRIDERAEKLLAGNRQISTAGRLPLQLRTSPESGRVAVLSADGQRGRSSLPFIGGGGATGQHYHQTLSLADFEPVGAATRLSRRQDNDQLLPCWSADEQFVFYFDLLHYTLSVVHTHSAE